MYKLLSPYPPDDTFRKLLATLNQMKAKVKVTTNRFMSAKIKIGFMSSILVHISIVETPYGSIVEFTTPELNSERIVDETFFGEDVASISYQEKKAKIKEKILLLKTSIDGLQEEDIQRVVNLSTKVKILQKCPNCGANKRKGFRCAYCNTLMIKIID